MGMKKWLCILLALLLMGVCALAESEGLDAPVDEQVLELGGTGLSDETITEGTAELQGQVVESEPVDLSMALDPETCSHAHAETYRGRYNFWEDAEPREVYEIKTINNAEHAVTGYCYTVTYCPDCDTDIEVIRDSAESTWTEHHEYDEGGYCGICCYRNDCAHSNKIHYEGVYDYERNEYQVRDLNDREHEVTGYYFTWDWCPDCEMDINISRSDEVRTWTEGHWYNGGDVCEFKLCGHVNQCKHANLEENDGVYYWQDDAEPHEDYQVEILNDREHEITGHRYTWKTCRDCGKDFDITRDPNVTTWTQGHWYNEDDVCEFYLCGHINECEHENVETNNGVYYWEDWAEPHEDYKVVSLNNREHQITGHRYTWKTCRDCGKDFDITRDAKVTTWTQGHWYNEDAVCDFDLCAHVNDCKHEHVDHNSGTYYWWDGEKYLVKSISDKEHKIKGHYYTWDWCHDCGMDINIRRGAVKTWTENHHYDRTDTCQFEPCGHVNACKHTNAEHNEGVYYWWEDAEPREDYKVKSLNDAEHQITGHKYTWDWCPDCDTDVNITRDPKVTTWTQHHWYDENGVCDFDLCGHVNKCQHKNVEHIEGCRPWEEGNSYKTKSISYRQHKIKGPYFSWDYCRDCDQDVNIKKLGTRTVTEGHDYNWDLEVPVCRWCGQRLTCKHPHYEEYEGAYDIEHNEYKAKSLNNGEHKINGYYFTWKWCPDCYQDFDIENHGKKTWKSGHWYDDHGYCRLCGHKCSKRLTLTSNKAITVDTWENVFINLKGMKATAYKSSNAKVADADNNMLYTHEAGTAIISIKLSNNKVLKIKVTVKDPLIPTDLKLKPSGSATVDMTKKPTVRIKYAINPSTASDAEVRWSSSNKNVAVVSKTGLVKFKSAGKVTITATTLGANNKKITAKLRINVKKSGK